MLELKGYIINNTLAQLNKDVKYISQYALKEKLGTKFPCLFADVYDNFENYSFGTDPMMNWYEIQNEFEKTQILVQYVNLYMHFWKV